MVSIFPQSISVSKNSGNDITAKLLSKIQMTQITFVLKRILTASKPGHSALWFTGKATC